MSRDYVEQALRAALKAIDRESAGPFRPRVEAALAQLAITLTVKGGLGSFYAATKRELALWSSISERIDARTPEGGAGSIDMSLRAMSDEQVLAIVEEVRELLRLVAGRDD